MTNFKKFIYKNFVWARSGGSFEPLGLNVTPPMFETIFFNSLYNDL